MLCDAFTSLFDRGIVANQIYLNSQQMVLSKENKVDSDFSYVYEDHLTTSSNRTKKIAKK